MIKKRNVTSLELPPKTRAALRRIKKNSGRSFTASVVQGVDLLEKNLGGAK
jgi:hypothetical protein